VVTAMSVDRGRDVSPAINPPPHCSRGSENGLVSYARASEFEVGTTRFDGAAGIRFI